MPNLDWQLVVALLAIAGAAAFLIHRGLRLLRTGRRASGACGTCGSCPAEPKDNVGRPTAFVPLESLAVQRRTD
jgi:hypothetical protein